MSKASGLAVAGLGLMLSACQVVGPDYHLPEEAAVHRPDFQGDLAVDGKTVVSAPVPADWWRLYKDPRLDQLVQQANDNGGRDNVSVILVKVKDEYAAPKGWLTRLVSWFK